MRKRVAETSFVADISAFVAKAKGREDLVVRKICMDLLKRIVMRSPVDTGRFRANWQVEIGRRPVGEITGFDLTGGNTIAAAAMELSKAKAGDIIYIYNNVPYAMQLEFGSSKQAPQGVVRVTLVEYGLIAARAATAPETP